jgi:hypothetical protein
MRTIKLGGLLRVGALSMLMPALSWTTSGQAAGMTDATLTQVRAECDARCDAPLHKQAGELRGSVEWH